MNGNSHFILILTRSFKLSWNILLSNLWTMIHLLYNWFAELFSVQQNMMSRKSIIIEHSQVLPMKSRQKKIEMKLNWSSKRWATIKKIIQLFGLDKTLVHSFVVYYLIQGNIHCNNCNISNTLQYSIETIISGLFIIISLRSHSKCS